MPAQTVLDLPADPAQQPDLRFGSVYFVGTATVIVRYGGFTFLTDPNFLHKGDHVHLGYGLKSERLTEPAIPLSELPPVDFVLLSHLHEDHFDRLVLRELQKDLPIITTPKAARKLRDHGFTRTIGLTTWQQLHIRKGSASMSVTSMPGTHAKGVLRYALPPVMGSMLEFRTAIGTVALRLYVSGDTLMYKQLHEIPRRFPQIDIALLHLGGTRVLGLLVTMDARQGVEAVKVLKARTTIPIYYDDYTVFKSPLEDFAKLVAEERLDDMVHYIHRGETYAFEVPSSRRGERSDTDTRRGATRIEGTVEPPGRNE